MEPKSRKHMNIGGWGLSWTIFGTYLGPRWSQDRFCDDLWRHAGSILEAIFANKLTFVGVIFASFSERHFLRIWMDVGAHFHYFWAPKPSPKQKRRKDEKHLCFIKGQPVFFGVDASLFWSKNHEKNGVGTRTGFGGDFFMIFASEFDNDNHLYWNLPYVDAPF